MAQRGAASTWRKRNGNGRNQHGWQQYGISNIS